VRVDPAGRIEAHHLGQEGRVVSNQAGRHAPRAQDFLAMVDIVQEGVDRLHALFDPLG